MLLFALALSLAPLDLIIYESGGLVTIDQSDVDPDDDLLVRGGPPSMTDWTYLQVTDMTVARSVTVDQGGSVRFEDASQILMDVTIENGGGCHLGDRASIVGALEIRSGGSASSGSSGTIGSVRVDQGAHLNGFHAVTVLGDMTIVGESYLGFATTIEGTTLFDGSESHLSRNTTFNGTIQLAGHVEVEFDAVDCHDVVRLADAARGRFSGTSLHGGLILEDASSARFLAGNTITGVMDLRASSSAVVVLLAANYSAGAIQDISGVITGTDLAGAPLSLPFVREPGAELIVAIYSPSIGATVCAQSIPNTLGGFAHITAAGSDLAAANELELTASNLPNNSFGYFLVGTQQGLVATPIGEVCVGGNIGRFVGPGQIMFTGSNGSYTLPIVGPFPGNPATTVVAGSTYIFQSWNREPFLNPPYNSRLSDAVSILFR